MGTGPWQEHGLSGNRALAGARPKREPGLSVNAGEWHVTGSGKGASGNGRPGGGKLAPLQVWARNGWICRRSR